MEQSKLMLNWRTENIHSTQGNRVLEVDEYEYTGGAASATLNPNTDFRRRIGTSWGHSVALSNNEQLVTSVAVKIGMPQTHATSHTLWHQYSTKVNRGKYPTRKGKNGDQTRVKDIPAQIKRMQWLGMN